MTVLMTLWLLASMSVQTAASKPMVIFVCEQGAAKSVIATAYLNKLASERGLGYRASFRGTAPQEALSERTLEGLRGDGIPIPAGTPAALDAAAVATSTHIFAIGCVLPAAAVASGKSADWSDVPDNQGYGPMRDAIVRHVGALVDQLAGAAVR
jgi:arsenate reductase (thioredoxin)